MLKKEKEIKISNKAIQKNKKEINNEKEKEKNINFKKRNKTPIKIDINLDNSYDKILLPSQKLLFLHLNILLQILNIFCSKSNNNFFIILFPFSITY